MSKPSNSARGASSKDATMSAREAEEHTDDMSTGLHLQQFMDEWYYRCLHSGLAYTWDREKCAVAALDLFELQGVNVAGEEKPRLAAMDDDDFIEAVVRRMPADVRKTFEHFALQLQLVMSAASRVRCALEEGSPEEVARIMEEGDQGVNSQILKQTIVEATNEVGEIREIHENWVEDMTKRMGRLGQCQMETESNKLELERINVKLSNFGSQQSGKSKKMLMSMSAQNDKAFLGTVFKTWWQWKVKYQQEAAIHEKFQKQIEDAQNKLIEYKKVQVKNIRQVLGRNSDSADKAKVTECFRVWAKDIQEEKEERELKSKVEMSRSKMGNLKAAQKANAQKSMMRIVAGNEDGIKNIAWQAWCQYQDEVKKTKDFEGLVKAQEERMQEFMSRKTQEAGGVLTKIAGASDTGLLHTTFNAWVDEMKQVRKAQELEDALNKKSAKLAGMSTRIKENATNAAKRCTTLEKENSVQQIFMHWNTEAKLGRLIRHYSGQMDSKKQQLEAVQTMFKSFATQLEQGISTTPRSTRKSNRSSSRVDKPEGQARPPQMPAQA